MRSTLALAALVLFSLPTIAHGQSTDDADDATPARAAASKASGKIRSKKRKSKGEKKASHPEPLPAGATDGDPTASPTGAPGAEEPLPSYDPSGDPAGATENPTAPKDWDAKPPPPPPLAVKAIRTGYPIEQIYRPLVLPRRMMQAALELPMTVDPGSFTAIVRGSYGATRDLQLGLRYAIVTAISGDTLGGKTVALDADYQVFSWLAGQISLPIGFDPLALGVVFGAPMKFTLFDRFSVEVLRDVVGVKLYRYLPSAVSPAESASLAAADRLNSIVPASEVDLGGRVLYQFTPELAGEARYNVRMPEFEATGAPHEATLGALYSTSNKLDLGARLGFLDLARASDSFVAQLSVVYRR
jgi:hypothetical protein